jgi:hypothetical protein
MVYRVLSDDVVVGGQLGGSVLVRGRSRPENSRSLIEVSDLMSSCRDLIEVWGNPVHDRSELVSMPAKSAAPPDGEDDDETLGLDKVLATLSRDLIAARNAAEEESYGLEVGEVEIELNVTVKKVTKAKGDIRAKIAVFLGVGLNASVGGEYSSARDTANKIKLKLRPAAQEQAAVPPAAQHVGRPSDPVGQVAPTTTFSASTATPSGVGNIPGIVEFPVGMGRRGGPVAFTPPPGVVYLSQDDPNISGLGNEFWESLDEQVQLKWGVLPLNTKKDLFSDFIDKAVSLKWTEPGREG